MPSLPHPLLQFNPSNSPLESFFDLPQLSVSFNVQDGGRNIIECKSFAFSKPKKSLNHVLWPGDLDVTFFFSYISVFNSQGPISTG